MAFYPHSSINLNYNNSRTGNYAVDYLLSELGCSDVTMTTLPVFNYTLSYPYGYGGYPGISECSPESYKLQVSIKDMDYTKLTEIAEVFLRHQNDQKMIDANPSVKQAYDSFRTMLNLCKED